MIPAIIAAVSALGAAGINAASSYSAQSAQLEARKEALKRLRQQGQITDSEYNDLINDITQYYDERGSLGTADDVNAYKEAIASYNPDDYVSDLYDKDFSDEYTKTIEDFKNPYYSRIISDTAQGIQHTAAGAGLGRGTGAALNIAKGVAEKEDELYKTAMEQYQDDRDFAYKEFQDAITNNQAKLNAQLAGTKYQTEMLGTLASDYYNTQDSMMSDLLKAQQDKMNAKTSYATAMGGLY